MFLKKYSLQSIWSRGFCWARLKNGCCYLLCLKGCSSKSFISELTFGLIPCNAALIWLSPGLEVVNNSWKYSQNLLSISSSSSCQFPMLSSIPSILFFLFLDDAFAWKNFVFLSPPLSQLALDLCFQYVSSSINMF